MVPGHYVVGIQINGIHISKSPARIRCMTPILQIPDSISSELVYMPPLAFMESSSLINLHEVPKTMNVEHNPFINAENDFPLPTTYISPQPSLPLSYSGLSRNYSPNMDINTLITSTPTTTTTTPPTKIRRKPKK